VIQRAIDHLRRAIHADPTNQDALFNMELLLRALGPSARTRRSGLDPNAPLGNRPGSIKLKPGFGY
jgi:hypothetical protein